MYDPQSTVEHDGRIYVAPLASVPMVQYPIPVDVEGQYVYDCSHDIIRAVMENNYYGPVQDVLAEDPTRTKRVVDFGCGSGRWVREMAEEFPHVQFTGIDLIPAWEEYDYEESPPNIDLVVGDIRQPLKFEDNTFDVVHIRQMRTAVTDYKALADEAARILRPGGLLLSGEWGRYTVMDNVRIEPNKYAPAYMLYTELVARAFEKNGPHMTAEAIVPLLRETGHFSISNDDYLTYPFPMGEAQFNRRDAGIGKAMSGMLIKHGQGLRYLIKDDQWTDDALDELEDDVVEELRTKRGIVATLFVLAARKR